MTVELTAREGVGVYLVAQAYSAEMMAAGEAVERVEGERFAVEGFVSQFVLPPPQQIFLLPEFLQLKLRSLGHWEVVETHNN